MLRVKYEEDTDNPRLFIQDENGIGFFPRVKKEDIEPFVKSEKK